jgi:hypothetical protein
VKRGGSLSFLVGTISNVLVMEIGWTDVDIKKDNVENLGPGLDRHKNVSGLNQLMGSKPSLS